MRKHIDDFKSVLVLRSPRSVMTHRAALKECGSLLTQASESPQNCAIDNPAFAEGVGPVFRELSQALEYLQVVRSRLVSTAGVKRVGVRCWYPSGLVWWWWRRRIYRCRTEDITCLQTRWWRRRRRTHRCAIGKIETAHGSQCGKAHRWSLPQTNPRQAYIIRRRLQTPQAHRHLTSFHELRDQGGLAREKPPSKKLPR